MASDAASAATLAGAAAMLHGVTSHPGGAQQPQTASSSTRSTELKNVTQRLIKSVVEDILREDLSSALQAARLPQAGACSADLASPQDAKALAWRDEEELLLPMLRSKLASDFAAAASRGCEEAMRDCHAIERLDRLDAQCIAAHSRETLPPSFDDGSGGSRAELAAGAALMAYEEQLAAEVASLHLEHFRRSAEKQRQKNEEQATANKRLRSDVKDLQQSVRTKARSLTEIVAPSALLPTADTLMSAASAGA